MGHILKRDSIQVEGRFSLERGIPRPGIEVVEGQDQARIIEQQDGFSIIELVCTCGRKMQIRCEHPV
jgi:hypothetical protein